ncbi:CapA family protein [Gordonia spumicola]|nr:CapA family protein [Gordonia spumicola]
MTIDPIQPMSALYRLFAGRTDASRSVEGNAGTMGLGEKLWWAHKFFVGAVEHAEPGKGIEEHFAAQDLSFGRPAGFVPVATARLSSAGDILTSEHLRPDTTAHIWDEVGDFLFGADLAVANLETPVAPSRPVGAPPKSILSAPPLNSSREVLEIFAGGDRFGFFSTANNHALDQGPDGVRETLDVLDEMGVGHVGTARTYAERDAIPVVDVEGVRVAFVSYTFSVNGRQVPAGEEHLVNYLRLNMPDVDLSMIERHVQIARDDLRADVVVACLHWSLEFESYPVRTVITNAHRIAELGVDVILGNHPHVVQPIERHSYVDGSGVERDALIVYAHGDLASYLDAVPNSKVGNLVRFSLHKGTVAGRETTVIADVSCLPILRRARFDRDGTCTDFRIHDLSAFLRRHEQQGDLDSADLAEVRRLADLTSSLLP